MKKLITLLVALALTLTVAVASVARRGAFQVGFYYLPAVKTFSGQSHLSLDFL